MKRYLLDTNVLLHVVNKANGHGLIEQRIATTQPDQIRISMIAGVVLVNDLVMVTDNVREFQRVPGLSVENWRNPQ